MKKIKQATALAAAAALSATMLAGCGGKHGIHRDRDRQQCLYRCRER